MSAGKPRLAKFVALAYTLVIVYASLQPFAGWRMPPDEVLRFLGAPWPRYVTPGDVLLNVAAYLPLGVMLFAGLRPQLPRAAAFAAATGLAVLLSLTLESAQMFLPTRIASNVDLLANGAGAAIGALTAWMLTLRAFADSPLATLRRRTLRADALGDCGLIVLALWISIQIHPAPLAFASGDWRELLHIGPLIVYTPPAYLLAEGGVVALAVAAIGLFASLLVRPQRPVAPLIVITLLLAVSAKSLAALTLARSAQWLQWVTPGVAIGLAGGIALLAATLQLSNAARGAIAAACVVAGTLVVNLAPENPYQAVPAFLLGAQPTHLFNFANIMRVLSQLWPLLAISMLIALARTGRAAH